MHDNLTTAAVLTPRGPGAIGVIRVCGPGAARAVSRLFQSRSTTPLERLLAERPDRLCYGKLVENGETIDDAIVSLVPRSPLPAVDIALHGGTRVMDRVLSSLECQIVTPMRSSTPLPLAWPAADRIEEEALEQMLIAKTRRAAGFLAWQRVRLPDHLRALARENGGDADRLRRELSSLLDGADAALTLLRGATVALLGPPNGGKSTLFNRLVGRPGAIVSPVPGTTRDWVTAEIELHGVPFTLIDTAGRRETSDPLERAAIEAGADIVSRADVCLHVIDGSTDETPDSLHPPTFPNGKKKTIVILNKCDRGKSNGARDRIHDFTGSDATVLVLSAETGENIEALHEELLRSLGFSNWVDFKPRCFTTRQIAVTMKIISDLMSNGAKVVNKINEVLIGGREA